MYCLSNICFICLKDIDKLKTVYVNGTEDAVIQIKYFLPEITLEPEIPVHICFTCHTKLHSFCSFKKQCLENYYRYTKKFQELGNAKNISFNALPMETVYIKEESQVDDDLINEAPEELNSQINCVTEQHDQTNNFIENIQFENSEKPNFYQELIPDIKKEIDSVQDINEIESTDSNINNSERTVSNLIISSDLNQKLNESDIKDKIKSSEFKICNKKFTQRSDLNSHSKINSKIKDYQCSICKKKFMKNSNLKQHMKTHTGVKDFQCSICEKKLTQNSQLKMHMKTHTGVKDFQCSICEKMFIKNSNLKRHMKTHTGVKDFQCSICEKKFIRNSHVKLHMKTHTGVKDFQCTICEKKFIQRSSMIRHMKLHNDIRDFECL